MHMAEPETDGLDVVVFVRSMVTRRGLEAVLRQVPTVRGVRHCANERSACELLARGDLDVLVVTPAEHRFVGPLPDEQVHAKVLVLLSEVDVGDPRSELTGADGFLVQEEVTTAHVHDVLQRVVAGEMPMPAGLGRHLLSRASTRVSAENTRPVALTPRECETLELLAAAMSNKQIARRLSISDHGAKRLVTSVMLKLGAPNRTAAVVNAINAGMIETGPALAGEELAPN